MWWGGILGSDPFPWALINGSFHTYQAFSFVCKWPETQQKSRMDFLEGSMSPKEAGHGFVLRRGHVMRCHFAPPLCWEKESGRKCEREKEGERDWLACKNSNCQKRIWADMGKKAKCMKIIRCVLVRWQFPCKFDLFAFTFHVDTLVSCYPFCVFC